MQNSNQNLGATENRRPDKCDLLPINNGDNNNYYSHYIFNIIYVLETQRY